MRLVAIVLCLLFLPPAPARADRLPFAKDCGNAYSWLTRRLGRNLPADELRKHAEAIGGVKMAELFPDSMQVPAGRNMGMITSIKRAQVGAFNNRFKDYLHTEARLNPDIARDMDAFESWLRTKPGSRGPFPSLNPIEIEREYKQKGLALKDFFYDQYTLFKVEALGHNRARFIDDLKAMNPRTAREVFGSLRRAFGHIFGYVSTGVVAGAVVANTGSVSNFAQGFSAPIVKYLFGGTDVKALGERQAEALIGTLTDFVEGGREQYKKSLAVLEEARLSMDAADMSGLKRDKAREFLDARDKEVGTELARFQKALDRAEKNRHKSRAEYFKGMLNALAIAKNDWNTQRAELEKITDQIRRRARPASNWEKKDISEMELSIKEAERTMAEVLVLWKVYKHTIGKEGPALPDEVEKPLSTLFGQYMRTMDLEEYKIAYMKATKGLQETLQTHYK